MTDITPEQRVNLTKLAAYLRTLPPEYPDFGMTRFVATENGYGDCAAFLPECGTAACAAGHGPKAGIPPIDGETWSEYSRRAFIRASCDPYDREWEWCFGANWARTDNTVHGAAARIEWFLARGLPDDAEGQRYGRKPLCYTSESTPS